MLYAELFGLKPGHDVFLVVARAGDEVVGGSYVFFFQEFKRGCRAVYNRYFREIFGNGLAQIQVGLDNSYLKARMRQKPRKRNCDVCCAVNHYTCFRERFFARENSAFLKKISGRAHNRHNVALAKFGVGSGDKHFAAALDIADPHFIGKFYVAQRLAEKFRLRRDFNPLHFDFSPREIFDRNALGIAYRLGKFHRAKSLGI